MKSKRTTRRPQYPWLPLDEIRRWLPEMERLGVSEVARSWRGFLTMYQDAGGNPRKVSDWWKARRTGFIRRHMVQYRRKPSYRRWLAFICWGYKPDRRFE